MEGSYIRRPLVVPLESSSEQNASDTVGPPEGYQALSWSWASLDAEVNFIPVIDFVRIGQNPTSEARVSHDQGHIYIPLWIHLSFIYTYIYGIYTINQLIPPIYWFFIAHKSSPLHVLLSSNL